MTDLLSCETTEASKICQVVFVFEFWCFLSLWAAESDWELNSALAILVWTGPIFPNKHTYDLSFQLAIQNSVVVPLI